MELFKLLGTIAISNSEANNALNDTTGKAESSSNSIEKAFKKIGTAIVAYLSVDKINSVSFFNELTFSTLYGNLLFSPKYIMSSFSFK